MAVAAVASVGNQAVITRRVVLARVEHRQLAIKAHRRA